VANIVLSVGSTYDSSERVLLPPQAALVGVLAALPFALLVLVVFRDAFGTGVGAACLVSGAVSGATFGRLVAADPTWVRMLLAPVAAVVIGTPVGAGITLALSHVEWSLTDFFGWTAAGLILYSLPAYLVLALPAFALGVRLAQRITSR
jgi:hypothetical protein